VAWPLLSSTANPNPESPVSLRLLAPLSVALLASACSSSSVMSMDAGDLGVSPGGAQDIGYIRDLIEQGYIPREGTWSAEGLFSEHDLPLDGPECEQILCPRAQAASLPHADRVIAQVGFGTVITRESFERRDLNLGLAVDISGSMSGGKLDAMKVALHALADRMTAADTVSLVAFDDQAELRLPATVMDPAGRAELRRAIDRLETRGSTNIEAGMKLAYDQVSPLAGLASPEDRVLLFTDAQPNVGATGIGSFVGMARYYGEAGIGLTVFGTGLDLGIELAQEMSEVRGGAYVYLPDEEAIAAAFDEDFDFLVTPLAYDLEVDIRPAAGWRFLEAIGAPMDDGPGDDGVEGVAFGASTLFLSSGGGGIAVLLGRDPDHEGEALPVAGEVLADFSLRYTRADDSAVEEGAIALSFEGGATWSSQGLAEQSPLADDLGVYKMSLLLDEVDALTAAGLYCEGQLSQEEALALVREARIRLRVVAEELGDAPLRDEAVLMARLAANLDRGAQCL
jgi:Ca-activated chloride channel homolog